MRPSSSSGLDSLILANQPIFAKIYERLYTLPRKLLLTLFLRACVDQRWLVCELFVDIDNFTSYRGVDITSGLYRFDSTDLICCLSAKRREQSSSLLPCVQRRLTFLSDSLTHSWGFDENNIAQSLLGTKSIVKHGSKRGAFCFLTFWA